MLPLIEYINDKPMLIAAHRGASNLFKENTLPAFHTAIEMGADMIELDVHFNENYEAVVQHDATSDSDTKLYLSDVLTELRHKVYFVVEIKPIQQLSVSYVIEQLSQVISSNNLLTEVVMASFDSNIISQFKHKFPDSYTAIIIENVTKHPSDYKAETDCNAIIMPLNAVTKDFAASATELGIFIGVYGAVDKDDYDSSLSLGVKVLGTDYIERFL